MSETDDLKKALNTALSRIAALESRPAPQSAPTFDAQGFTRDPIGAMTRYGVPVDHVARVMVAHVMGDQAPPELRALAAMGPQVSQTQALSSELDKLRQRVEQYETREREQAARSSFSALAADKTKYPTLAAVYARDPKLFDGEVTAHKGDAAALAEAIEGRLKVIAPALGVPQTASTANAAKPQQDQSKSPYGEQVKQAQAVSPGNGPVDPTPPPLPQGNNKPGVFTQEDHQSLRDRIVAKYSKNPE